MPAHLRLLLVEDCQDDAELLVLHLQQGGYQVTSERVETSAEMAAALEKPWDIVISDFSLPNFSGVAALELLKNSGIDLPFIVVSGQISEEAAVAALKQGLRDYIPKGNLARLLSAVARELGEAQIKKARREAEEEARRLAAIVEGSEDAIVGKTLEGKITSWNPGAERLYGWTAAEMVGTSISRIVPPERGPELANFVERIKQGQRITHHETVRMRKDGTLIDVSVTVSPIKSASGNLVGISTITRDITEQVLLREQQHTRLRQQQVVVDLGIHAIRERNIDALMQEIAQSIARTLGTDFSRVLAWSPDCDFLRLQAGVGWMPGLVGQATVDLQDSLEGHTLSTGKPVVVEDLRNHPCFSISPLLSQHGVVSDVTVVIPGPNHPFGILGASSTRLRDFSREDVNFLQSVANILATALASRQAREALGLSEERIRKFVHSTLMGFIAWNTKVGIRQANDAFLNMVGYTQEDLYAGGVRLADLTPPEYATLDAQALKELQSAGQYSLFEKEFIRKDGSRVPVLTSSVALDTVSEEWITLVLDISERKRAEATLMLRDRAIQAVTQGIIITDPNLPDNPIIYVSPGFTRLTGYPAEESLGRNCRFLQNKDTDPDALARLREAIRAAQPGTFVLLNSRKDGSTFWVELSISPVHDPAGRLMHFVGVQSDVTERRRLEEQYRQSQKLEAVGRLAGGVAHDFNNLLTIISGYSDLLLMQMTPDNPARKLVQEIHHAGERSTALTRQLLAFSRKQVIQPQVLDLSEVVAVAQKMLRRMIGEDVLLETNLKPLTGRIKADPGQMEQVLMNLAINSRDAMPCGGTLTIDVQELTTSINQPVLQADIPPGHYVLLAVADTGSGMTEETKARIIEPFFTTKEPGKGTGLGLAVVYGIIKEAGGHIFVESTLGVGTTFKIYLPTVDEPPTARKSSPSIRSAPHGTETLLLVEDEVDVRCLTSHVLRNCGYTVLEAADGLEGLRVAQDYKNGIHLLVTDVVMPQMGGRALAEQFLSMHHGAKVLYVSGYADDAVVRHGILEDKVAFLAKPFSPKALAVKVREVLDSPAMAGAGSAEST